MRGKMARLSHEFVKSQIEESGYRLNSSYERSDIKLSLACPKSHDYEVSWNNFNAGSRCPYCAGKAVTHKMVKAEVLSVGYKLHSQYRNSKEKLSLTCAKGHNYEAPWHVFQGGSRCPYCAGNVKSDHDQVKAQIESFGFKLNSIYEGSNKKLLLTCPNGHDYKATWSKFQQGTRCPHCAGQVVTHEQVEAKVESAGYQLNSTYRKNSAKLSLTCDKGHDYEGSWSVFRRGGRCPYCAKKRNDHEQVKAKIESVGYQLNSVYKRTKSKLSITCDKGHEYKGNWDHFNGGKRCPHCASSGFKALKPAILYYVRFQHEGNFLYKIGITNLTVDARFKQELASHTIISHTNYLLGSQAYQEEQRILRQYKDFLYKGNPFLKEKGNTELFTKDVLGLDSEVLTIARTISHATGDSAFGSLRSSC
jgi:predicted Zn-ribbon and HTH transcriptional regulator